jgi:hypothetical protein
VFLTVRANQDFRFRVLLETRIARIADPRGGYGAASRRVLCAELPNRRKEPPGVCARAGRVVNALTRGRPTIHPLSEWLQPDVSETGTMFLTFDETNISDQW